MFKKNSLITMFVIAGSLHAAEPQAHYAPNPYPAAEIGVRLTPAVGDAPRIHVPAYVGAVHQKPFIYRIPISGKGPLDIKLFGLPEGLSFDSQRGIISGTPTKAGGMNLRVEVSNASGRASKEFCLSVGKSISLTPPMGWNSWYCQSELVSQESMLQVARFMHESGLADFGWSYVNIDDCWQGVRDARGRLQANERFPNMTELCDEIHALGLRAGIYSTPWISTYAGFRGGSSDDELGDDAALALTESERLQKHQIFGRWPGLDKLHVARTGKYWFFNQDAAQWAEWGFDFVKVDWKPNDAPTTMRVAKDIAAQSRAMFLSLSNAAPYENMSDLMLYANATRTTGDIHDTWESVSSIGFSQERWQSFLKPGHWPDPDMLQVGMLATPNQQNTTFRPTRLTPDEQYSQVSLWCILSAPLLLSCDLSQLDDFTLGLLCNASVISVNQDPYAKPAQVIWREDGFEVWVKPLLGGSQAVAIFNRKNEKRLFSTSPLKLGVHPGNKVIDLWREVTLSEIPENWQIELNPHGVLFLKITR